LDEFELLEQFAEDDASFLSSVSAVNKVLQQKKVISTVIPLNCHPPNHHQLQCCPSKLTSLKLSSL